MPEGLKPWEAGFVQASDKAQQANNGPMPWETPGGGTSVNVKNHGLNEHPRDLHIVEQMHPDLTLKDRAIIQNFGNDDEAVADYLRERYPNIAVGFVNDRVVMKGKDGNNYPVIPNFDPIRDVSNPKELAADIAGQGANVTKMAGTTLAGMGGAAAGLGAGSLPAAMVASGTTAAGLEALRQKIGQQLGVNKEMKYGPIAMEGALNAAAPGLFGVGKTPGLAQGIYNVGTEKVLPKIGAMASGLDVETIKRGAKYLPEIKEIEKNGVQEFANKAHADINEGLQAAKGQIGQQMNDKMAAAGTQVDIAPVREKFQNLIDKLKLEAGNGRNTPEMQAKISEVQDLMDHYLTEVPPEGVAPGLNPSGTPNMSKALPKPIEKLSPASAFNLKQTLADLGDLENVSYYGGKSNLSEMSPAQREIAMVARDAKSALDKQITGAVDESASVLGEDPKSYTSLKSQYRKLSQLQDEVEPHFRTPEKTFNTLRNSSAKNKQYLMETLANTDKDYGTNTVKNAGVLDAYNTLGGSPSMSPISSGGVTSTSRTIPAAVGGGIVGGTIAHYLGLNPYVGTAAGMYVGKTAASPAAIRNYLEAGALLRKAGEKAQLPIRGALSLGMKSQFAPTTYDVDTNALVDQLKAKMNSPWTLFPRQEDPNNPQGAAQ